MWKEFLQTFNGKCFFFEDCLVMADNLQLYTDALGRFGYGAVFQNRWLYGEWNGQWIGTNITVKELYPIVLAIELWGREMANMSICFNCDNEALVYVLNKHTSSEPKVMFLISFKS